MGKRGWFTAFTLLAAFWLAGSPAQASGDYGCPVDWTLQRGDYNRCSNLAALAPGNDTRVNLLLLLRDDYSGGRNSSADTPFFRWSGLAAGFAPPEPEPEDYPEFSHSRCQSNASGTAAFVKAVRAARLRDEEAEALIAARREWRPNCDGDGDAAPVAVSAGLEVIRSEKGREFITYFLAATAFYDGDFDRATAGFASLYNAGGKWLRETGRYMVGRSELNRAMATAFDQYGWFEAEQVDTQAVAGAREGFASYLKAYPKGEYAGSAQGLLRRVAWLAGDAQAMAAEYSAALQRAKGERELVELIQELDYKLLPEVDEGLASDDPALLAMTALYRMRKGDDEYGYGEPEHPLTRAELAAMEPAFAARPDLFAYLQASFAYYREDDPQAVLRLIPASDAQKLDMLAFSRQLLRGMALSATGDAQAKGFWVGLIGRAAKPYQRPAAELGLALHHQRNGTIAELFAAQSPVREAAIRELLLAYSAAPELLLQQSGNAAIPERERRLAQYVLLYKTMVHGRYDLFAQAAQIAERGAGAVEAGQGALSALPYEADYDYYDEYEEGIEAIPVGIFFAPYEYRGADCHGDPVIHAVQRLRQPRNARIGTVASSSGIAPLSHAEALICVTEFLRTTGFDQYWLNNRPDAKELGGVADGFPGQPLSRLDVYRELMTRSDVPRDLRAYALFRAVWCYGPAGYNSCGGEDVPVEQRKAWFQDLKGNYADTEWARELKYYW